MHLGAMQVSETAQAQAELVTIIGFLWGEVPYPPQAQKLLKFILVVGVGEPKILRLPQKTREA